VRQLLALLVAMWMCAACSHVPETIEVPKPVAPPAEYLQECVAKLVPIKVNGDLVRNYAAVKTALKLCNADKAALRAWAAAVEEKDVKDLLLDMATAKEVSLKGSE
jgi:uncharacterized lipoprotein YajG